LPDLTNTLQSNPRREVAPKSRDRGVLISIWGGHGIAHGATLCGITIWDGHGIAHRPSAPLGPGRTL
jgi:hypothetical protein